MKKPGISKAVEALRRARAASKAMRDSKDPDTFLIGWGSFLSAFQITYNMMFGVVDDKEPTELHWKNRLKTDRQNDPVLSWLTAARHVDEHSPAFTIQHIRPPTLFTIGMIPENSTNPKDVINLFSNLTPAAIVLNPLPSWIKGSTKSIDPPEHHFGKSLRGELGCTQLWDVTDIALDYLDRMIDEARMHFTIKG